MGCNKVMCSQCGFTFCWMCGGDYLKTHDYPREAWGCNKPPMIDSTEGADGLSAAERARIQLKRRVHFSDRFDASLGSAKLMMGATERTEAVVGQCGCRKRSKEGQKGTGSNP
jgi:hypothetical protein